MTVRHYEQLRFNDDFMFCKVLQTNPDICKELLELILEIPIGDLVRIQKQYPIEIMPDGRGVRFDVYAKDDSSVIYDIEMQNALNDDLPKRARYATSVIDVEEMERSRKYSSLPRSYVIFICNFNIDPKAGRHKYSFRNLCVEDPEIELGDETEKVFLCTRGKVDDISDSLKHFLSYVAGEGREGELANKLDNAVDVVRKSQKWRKEYMFFYEHLDMAKEEGREEGRAELRAEFEKEKKRADRAEAQLAEAMKTIQELKEKLST